MCDYPLGTNESDITAAGQATRPSDAELDAKARLLVRSVGFFDEPHGLEIDDSEILDEGDECTIVTVMMTVDVTVPWNDV